MWNFLKTLSERDSARLRRLESDFTQLADDVEMCVNMIPKINARLRARAMRAAQAETVEDEETPPSAEPILQGSAVAYTKDQLRDFARRKGIRA